MPTKPQTHKPLPNITKRHETEEPTWGQGRGGRPWRRKRERVLLRDGYICQVCGRVTRQLEMDHIVPMSQGGSEDEDNLRAICVACHRIKTAKEKT